MSGTDLHELERPPPTERPEVIEYALTILTVPVGEPAILPKHTEGAAAARDIAERFSLGRSQAYEYVRRARQLIAEEFTAELPGRARLLSSLSLAVAREAFTDRDWPGVNGAVRNLCTIYGIDSKTVTVKGGGVDALLEAIKTAPGARDAEIEALEAKEREDAADGTDAG